MKRSKHPRPMGPRLASPRSQPPASPRPKKRPAQSGPPPLRPIDRLSATDRLFVEAQVEDFLAYVAKRRAQAAQEAPEAMVLPAMV